MKLNILQRMQRFCAYRERCVKEVAARLNELGADEQEARRIITALKQSGFLNEERFARTYAGAKFRVNRWGKEKIARELQARNIDAALIDPALKEINDKEYVRTLSHLIEKKSKTLAREDPVMRSHKVARWCVAKGYEAERVWKCLKDLRQ